MMMANTPTTFATALQVELAKNIDKLRARYGEKFTQAAALVRDLDKERKALEG